MHSSINDKFILGYPRQDLDHEIDPHAHEKTYSRVDFASMMAPGIPGPSFSLHSRMIQLKP